MDKINRSILDQLRSNSRTSFLQIAKGLGVSEGTIRKRVKNMLEMRRIRKFTIEESFDTSAIIEIVTSAQVSTNEIVASAKEIPGVQHIFEVAGRFTVLCVVKTESLEAINDIVEALRDIRGVLQTETFPVLKQI